MLIKCTSTGPVAEIASSKKLSTCVQESIMCAQNPYLWDLLGSYELVCLQLYAIITYVITSDKCMTNIAAQDVIRCNKSSNLSL